MTSYDGDKLVYFVSANWLNGVDLGWASSGPYAETISGKFDSFDEAQGQKDILFKNWRSEHPGSDGWKAKAWPTVYSCRLYSDGSLGTIEEEWD